MWTKNVNLTTKTAENLLFTNYINIIISYIINKGGKYEREKTNKN